MPNKKAIFIISWLVGLLLLASCKNIDDSVKTDPMTQNESSSEFSTSDNPSATPKPTPTPIPTPTPTPFVLPANVHFAIEPNFDYAEPFNAFGYAVVGVKTNGVMKYGMINESGAFVIEPEYDSYRFSEMMKYTHPEADIGYTWLQKGGLWGFVNEKCEWVVECMYDDCLFFTDIGFSGVEVDGKWGFISTSGEMVVEPMYDDVDMCYGDDYAKVCTNGLWGLIDREGKVVLDPAVTDLITDSDIVDFGYWSSAGYDVFLINGYRGLMALDGEMLIENAKDWIYSISSNGLVFADSSTNGTGFFNTEGELKIALQENEHSYGFTDNGLAIVETQAVDGSKTYRYINENGNTVIDGPFEKAYSFAPNGIASVIEGGVLGYIDMTGAYVIELQFNAEWSMGFDDNGFTGGTKDGKWAIMDDTGKLLTDYIYDDCSRPYFDALPESVFAVEVDGKWGLIHADGHMIIEPQFEDIIFSNPYSLEGWDIINYTDANLAMTYKDGKYGIISLQGEILLGAENEYMLFQVSENGYTVFLINGKYGYVDVVN